MCADCNYAPECYACMVGVATGPESHSSCCPAARRFASPTGVTHRVHVMHVYGEERASWECSCGRAGSCVAYNVDLLAYNVDLHSDRHIDYSAGDRRIDTSRAFS